MNPAFALLEAFGLTIVPVARLRGNVVLVRDQGVVLVRPDLDDETCAAAVDYLLPRVASLGV